jgi:hypothetical protein
MSPSESQCAARMGRWCGPNVAMLRLVFKLPLTHTHLGFGVGEGMGKNFGKRESQNMPIGHRDSVSFGLRVAVVVFLLVAGLGAFMFASGIKIENVMRSFTDVFGQAPNTYQSAASECEKDWVPRAQNDPQLMCLLTTHIERLCKAEEREHLVYVYNKYSAARVSYYADVAQRALHISADMQGLQEELAAATRKNFDSIKANIEGRATVVAGDDMARVIAKMKQVALGGPDGERAENVRRVPDEQIALAIRTLAEQGYIGKWDFGLLPDKLVAAGFSGVIMKQDKCQQ